MKREIEIVENLTKKLYTIPLSKKEKREEVIDELYAPMLMLCKRIIMKHYPPNDKDTLPELAHEVTSQLLLRLYLKNSPKVIKWYTYLKYYSRGFLPYNSLVCLHEFNTVLRMDVEDIDKLSKAPVEYEADFALLRNEELSAFLYQILEDLKQHNSLGIDCEKFLKICMMLLFSSLYRGYTLNNVPYIGDTLAVLKFFLEEKYELRTI